ncbi:MAG: DsbE family thiol:disulfide interchange protein [Rhodospirillaceae bacterium]|jgi:cytochrome c biogenesis protein CcmG, thiol:disulfide interchange protein DsbE|nr:DsbE family thiol:disulfide interchange protein [Rhodospirillaceae bacterium]MBT5243713.1 DsbE family thiol:disulfide interchange protein [Rhodospirillaceae bacterium]MBT5563810.1 DsbE family thiol:disulfide interchange protein [Rhodospirillaceae bacterium]MBT6241701.1 DsbE family thiol:disulfide interchange protein [Rhodospirillaceae bacterium]MBT7138191.1 DsbE family thiol:disulfide interchange protein [Rhodospirillaceae bacterium]
MNRMIYLLPLAIFLVIAGYFAKGLTLNPRDMPSMLIDQEVPPFDLKPIKGSMRGFSSEDLKGQVTLVNIFGSWCVACLAEHPMLMKIHEQKLVPIYGIDWREKDPEAGPKWLARRGDPYTLIGDDPESKAAIAFGVTGAPETFFIDRRGFIRYKHVGPITPENWESTLWPIVQELRKL